MESYPQCFVCLCVCVRTHTRTHYHGFCFFNQSISKIGFAFHVGLKNFDKVSILYVQAAVSKGVVQALCRSVDEFLETVDLPAVSSAFWFASLGAPLLLSLCWQ